MSGLTVGATKALEYTVVLCDMTTESPGYKYADIYHPASTMEYDALLKVAKQEDIDGIIINSEPTIPEIPLLIYDYSGIDLCKLLVSTAVRDTDYWDYVNNYERHYRYAIKQTTFSKEAGKYAGLYIDESIKQYVTRTLEYLKEGDEVEKCVDGTSLVAIVDLIFPDFGTQLNVYEKINDLIAIKVR